MKLKIIALTVATGIALGACGSVQQPLKASDKLNMTNKALVDRYVSEYAKSYISAPRALTMQERMQKVMDESKVDRYGRTQVSEDPIRPDDMEYWNDYITKVWRYEENGIPLSNPTPEQWGYIKHGQDGCKYVFNQISEVAVFAASGPKDIYTSSTANWAAGSELGRQKVIKLGPFERLCKNSPTLLKYKS